MNGSNDCRRRTTRNPRSNATVPNAVGLRVPREVNFAFEWLERGSLQFDSGLSSVKVDPLLKNLHGNPRWRGATGHVTAVIDPRSVRCQNDGG
jgi:hypothetical protein